MKDFKALGKEFTSDESTFELVSSYTLSDYESYIWHNANKTKGILAYVNQENIIVAFQVLDLEAYPETDTLFSTIQYQLPFHDEWFVYWGGHDVMTNYHYAHETNRYAYDFVKVVDGSTYKGDPLENESYFAFNQDIVAPAKGIVVAVVDGIADNMPGVLNSSQPEGNMVVIEHEDGEYSILAHFKQNSIVVKVTFNSGQSYIKGDIVSN